jgi:phosphatidylinositol 4-phosphatase
VLRCPYICVCADIVSVFDTTHAVYCVNGVTAIPLVEDRARIVINTLAAKNAALLRPSLLHHNPYSTDDPPDSAESLSYVRDPSARVVQFSNNDQVKIVSPLHPQESVTSNNIADEVLPSSGSSTPLSDDPVDMAAVARAIAARLSFWNKLSKRTPRSPLENGQREPMTIGEQQKSLDALFKDEQDGPREVLDSILAETAPPPATSEEKHSQLEDKIVRECIREYTKGGMYFAYNFGVSKMSFLYNCNAPLICYLDLTRSLQHRQEQFAKCRRQHDLLVDLQALEDVTPKDDRTINVLAEPYPTLPLWRRVDRQFWWNEWLSKPFVDAGV